MRVLTDRHHAGLLYSLQLLFEDRLGMELYVPVGHGWWDDGTWRFGEVFEDDRLAQQYLVVHDGVYEARDGYYVTRDREFPEREIRCVTPEQFRILDDWRFVMPSVQENQHGYWRLARACGATYLYQVGNRGQRVDWSLDPICLISAEAPIEGRGINYHQEFDKDGLFRPRPLPQNDADGGDSYAAASFVNCFNSMPPQWEYFRATEVEAGAYGLRFDVYGQDGRDGKLCPTTEIAEAMALYGFAWHDKPQGDGFGHVVHYWAAVGRPLVGRASNYRGLFAGPLWEDGVTAIFTDDRQPHETARLMFEVAEDFDRHEMMCHRIRARLDDLVDYAREEREIRSLLGL